VHGAQEEVNKLLEKVGYGEENRTLDHHGLDHHGQED
jgi:hypothetical protein